MKISNYIIAHKNFKVPNIEGYVPIQVGAEGKDDLGYLKDNVGDNISIKNPNYCELTGMYWIWKNDKDSDIIGISHYRRYFTTIIDFNKNILNTEKIKKILKKYDIILARREIYNQTVYSQYCAHSGFSKDLELVRNIIKTKYSAKYTEAFNKIIESNSISQYNMLITSKEIYNDYCKWLFEILFEVEKNVDLEKGYDDYQKRIYGFMSERLLNVWVEANSQLKIKRLPVVNTEISLMKSIEYILRRMKNYVDFHRKKEIKGRT